MKYKMGSVLKIFCLHWLVFIMRLIKNRKCTLFFLIMIFIFSIIAGLHCSVNFLLNSKVTQLHIHVRKCIPNVLAIHCCITSFPKIQWFKTTVHIISDSFWGLWIWVAQLGLSGLGCLIRLQSDVACSVSRWGLTGARRQTSKVAHVGSSPQGLSTVCVSSQQGSWLPSEWATWETIIDIGMPFLTRPWQSLIIMSAMLYWTPRPALLQCRKEITQGWDARRWGSWGAGGRLATTPKSTLR